MRGSIRLISAAVLSLGAALSHATAEINIVNLDPDGVGFNDPTPVEPVGGNTATTLGEQRLAVFAAAATLWEQELDSVVPINVGAAFAPLACTPTGGTLGSAGPTMVNADFDGALLEATWYVGALADALSGVDQDTTSGFPDIVASFNGDIGVNPDCLTGLDWYNGLDGANDPATEFDLLAVVAHEIGHGLGFLELASLDTGAFFLGLPDAYLANIFDLTLGRFWTELTDEERLFSQVNSNNLVWGGDGVTILAPDVLGPRPSARLFGRTSLPRNIEVSEAAFGPSLGESRRGTFGLIVPTDDGVGVTTDGCEPLTSNIRFRIGIALIDRGGCSFVQKALNAQAAGARAVIIANNVPGPAIALGGGSPDVTIPVVGVSQDEGAALQSDLSRRGGFVVTRLSLDDDFSAGADGDTGLVRLFAPNPAQPGSSNSHFDTSASPNLLMEPAINDDLAPTVNLDLTPALLGDTGWPLVQ